MLSILIPTYNYDVTNLVTEIHKQCNETAISFEIIVSDDASSKKSFITKNDSITFLKNVSLISNTVNVGRTANRNKLVENSNYSWLLFLDADVMPASKNFIKNYIEQIDNKFDVIFGGIAYSEKKPLDKEKLLRWHYGKQREAKSVSHRKKKPHFIISQNLLIKKETFTKANTLVENHYGLDNFFSNRLKNMNAAVLHVKNPVIHHGLENTEVFLEKSLQSVKSTFTLEKDGLLDYNLRPMQQSYLKLKKWRLTKLFNWFIGLFKNMMEANFRSSKPNLFWFDLYRLHYYIKLKRAENA
ncbi:glycosyltransferase family 2 protein [Patiriisocius hiemis]|uniref:Glycosyltransferase n=1 Tax=Patiriisocius hiemis TaxID=3075604 RepID=A0ABU2YEX1_9FLAO|nr:glycosyltransferase [Constantimarinum sp. W242]MDT0556713.1 glycosyltransferase [Constantimarinum sp. W242]